MERTTFYHAGCPVCVSAEQEFLQMVDKSKYEVEIVHLGKQKDRITEAERAGVKSVPAVVTPSGNVLHLNFGASVEDVKA